MAIFQDMTVFMHFCPEHKISNTRYCAHAFVDKNNNVEVECQNVFYRVCLSDRGNLMTNKRSKEKGYFYAMTTFFMFLGKEKT